MCGISGIINIRGIDLKQIVPFSKIISHRGPDDEGYIAIDENSQIHCAWGDDTPPPVRSSSHPYTPAYHLNSLLNKAFILAFGHRRLSIIDLSPSGHQPMSFADGRYWIVYNGEIYNYKEIKADLEKLGYYFKTKADVEVILAAYAEWGVDCLQRFAGMWAFAIFDQKKNEVFLARDRYGIKPLYYWFSPDGTFYFASEIKQFTVLNGWSPRINPQRIYDYLRYSFADHTDETMFMDVHQLPGGTYFQSSLKEIRPNRDGKLSWIKWYAIKREEFKGTFDDAASIFCELFKTSVMEHLQSDVPVGTALSGGIDSSSIVCQVNQFLKEEGDGTRQKTFSSCSIDPKFDERKWMDIVILQIGVDAHFYYPELSEVFSETDQILWHQDEPYQSQSAFLAYNVFRLAGENDVKVLLNGQGADEYLGGYGQFTTARYADMVKKFRLVKLLREIEDSGHNGNIFSFSSVKATFIQLLPTSLKRIATETVLSRSAEIAKIIDFNKLGTKPAHPFNIIPAEYQSVPEISKHLTFYSTLPKYLHWEDRNSMAHSVEARVPFLDHRLVEFTYNLPDDFLDRSGVTKRVMRSAMSGLLPEEIRLRKDKKGFITPEERWVRQDNPAWFRKRIEEAVSVTGKIIKPEALNFYDKVVNGEKKFDYTYWRIILFSLWMEKFNIRNPD